MQENLSHKNRYSKGSNRLVPVALIVCLVISGAFVVLSKTAYAGIFTSIWSILGNEEAAAQIAPLSGQSLNSQKYPLPSYSANGDTIALANTSTAVAPIQDGSTLSSDMISEGAAVVADNHNTQISVYTVRSGDTISTVAEMFNVSINTILWANDLTSKSVLQQGKTLVILPVTGITYTVKKGDTIQAIAKKYGADVTDILNYNNITLSSPLAIGAQILLPDAELSSIAASPAQKSSSLSISTEPVSGSTWPSYRGYFSCPLPSARVSQGLHGHNGVDLAAARGTPIRAAAAGTVIISRANGAWNGGYGNFIVILHGNSTQTLYSHMQKATVTNGESVAQNEIIGYVGMTGLTTGPHVHFEIRGAQNPFSDSSLCR